MTFRNKVCGKAVLEEVRVLKGVVQLRVGHGPALEPAVEHLLHAPQGLAPTGAGDGQAVDEVAVQVGHLPPAGALAAMRVTAGL